MTAVLFVGMWLAAYRVTRLITDDTLLNRPREWFFRRYPPDADYASLQRKTLSESGASYWQRESSPVRKVSMWGELMWCAYCIGFWISGAVVALVNVFVSVRVPVLWWWATSAAVGLTARNLDSA